MTDEITTTRESRQNSDRHHRFILDFGPGPEEISYQIQLLGTSTYDPMLNRSIPGCGATDVALGHSKIRHSADFGFERIAVVQDRRNGFGVVPGNGGAVTVLDATILWR